MISAFKRLSTGRGNLVKRSEELKLLGAKTKKAIADKLLPASDT
jgi:DNA recombination protein RmuC